MVEVVLEGAGGDGALTFHSPIQMFSISRALFSDMPL